MRVKCKATNSILMLNEKLPPSYQDLYGLHITKPGCLDSQYLACFHSLVLNSLFCI